MKTIYFATSNARKVEDYSRRFAPLGFEVVQLDIELNEGRSLDILEIAKAKLEQAKAAYPNYKIIVEDRGFIIPSLNNFPGPFVKVFLDSIGIVGILDLMINKKDKTVKFVSVLGYFDGTQDHFFQDIETGFLLDQIKGDNLRGWTDILYIYGHPIFPDQSLAELSDSHWQEYLNETEKQDYLTKFSDFLKLD